MTEQKYMLVGDELLVAAFHDFEKGIVFSGKVDIPLAFYELSKKPEYKELFLREYAFDEDGPVPYSKGISEALEDLMAIGLIERNASAFLFRDSIRLRFMKYIDPRLSNEQRELIYRLGNDLQQLLK